MLSEVVEKCDWFRRFVECLDQLPFLLEEGGCQDTRCAEEVKVVEKNLTTDRLENN